MNRIAWKQISEPIVTKTTKIYCFQELIISEQKGKTKRQQLDAIAINYTTEDGQAKRIPAATGNIPVSGYAYQLARRRRELENDTDQVLARPIY